MAEIQLKCKNDGSTRAFPLAVLNWDNFISAGGTYFSASMINVSDVSDTHKTFYYIDQQNIAAEVISGLITADSEKNLLSIGEAENYLDNFTTQGASVPWASFDTVQTWEPPVQNANALEAHGTFVANRTYYGSGTASNDFETANGGSIGGAIALVNGGSNTILAICNVGANQSAWTGGLYQQTRNAFTARFGGQYCIDFSTHPTRSYSNAAVGYTLGDTYTTPYATPDRFITQCVYTVIDGYPYIAMCAILVDAVGVPEKISGVFIPAWFWGDFSQPQNPDEAPKYYGIDAGINGGDGDYTESNTPPNMGANYQPFSTSSADGYGLHVYKINAGEYELVQAALWGAGAGFSALWDKWVNYKFNPIASIIACHHIPSQFIPTITPEVKEQLRAGGTHIISSKTVPYLNSKTTVFHSFLYAKIGKFFSNHLAYSPYSHFNLFLPFCGNIEIPADRVRGGGIQVHYRCDIITGNVVAFVECTDQSGEITCQYSATGNCALSVPVTGHDSGTGTAVGAISGLALGMLTGNPAGVAAGAAGAALSIASAQHATKIQGQFGGSVGALGQLSVVLTITQPVQQDTDRARDLRGLVSYVDSTIADLAGTGYTEIAEVRADIAGATDAEKQAIEDILKGGVYF